MIEWMQTFNKVYPIQINKKSIVDNRRFCEMCGFKAALVGICVYAKILQVLLRVKYIEILLKTVLRDTNILKCNSI